MKHCNSLSTQWRLPASAGWLLWIVDLDDHLLKGTPNSAIDWIQVRAVWGTCEARWSLRSHAARNTPTYLRRENVTFIEPHMWPTNSRDLNPVNCAVWGALQQMLCQRRRFTTINQLKQAIVTEWGKLLQRFIDRAIGQWRRRLEWVVI